MKKLFFLLFMGALLITSCDKNDDDYQQIMANLVDVHVQTKYVKSITIDDDTKLKINEGMTVSKDMERPDTTYRMMLYYLQKENEPISIVSSIPVPVIKPVEIAKAATQKKDPIGQYLAWMSKNGKYLNLNFTIYTSVQADGTQVKHIFDVVLDNMTEGTNKTLDISLRHDSNGASAYYQVETYLSIPTSDLRPGDVINLTLPLVNGEKKETITVK